MKTAMQELLDNLNAMQIDGIIQLLPSEKEMITYMFNKALEKEKEQIIDAYNFGQQIPPFDYAEEYYNQTYKQDKITINQTKRSIEGIGLNNQNK
jgi:hypothetical protein